MTRSNNTRSESLPGPSSNTESNNNMFGGIFVICIRLLMKMSAKYIVRIL